MKMATKVVAFVFMCAIRGKKAARWPCGVYNKGVGSNSLQCTRSQKWVHKKCSGIKVDNCTVGGLLIRHWSVDVESGNGETGMEHNSTCSLFSVIVTLTDDGLDHLCPVCLLSPPQYFHANLLSTPYGTVMECIWCTIEENFSILSQFKCACCCHRGLACSKDFSPIKSTSS